MLCALGPAERRGALRGISVSVQCRCQPPAPLDSGGLADCAMAAAARSRPERPPEQSAFRPLPLEDFRQPPAQSRAFRNDAAVAAWLDGFVSGLVLDLVGSGRHSDSAPARLDFAFVSEAR